MGVDERVKKIYRRIEDQYGLVPNIPILFRSFGTLSYAYIVLDY